MSFLIFCIIDASLYSPEWGFGNNKHSSESLSLCYPRDSAQIPRAVALLPSLPGSMCQWLLKQEGGCAMEGGLAVASGTHAQRLLSK